MPVFAAAVELPDPNNYASIGWVIVVLGVIVVMINQVSEMVARHKAKDPDPPLHKEYISRAEHLAHVEDVNDRFAALNEDRRVNVIKLHEKIDLHQHRQAEANNALRLEIKRDTEGVHTRVTQLLAEVATLTGSLRTALKNSSHPFSSK